jgi:hypothetical protein
MTSGIYLVNFSGNAYYIGKSNDLERRWKEHRTKFQKGTAAKLMQAAYDRWGMPDFTVHVVCHEDHIDLLESICISHNKHILLNTTQPQQVSVEDREVLLSNADLMRISTADHIRKILELKDSLRDEYIKNRAALKTKEQYYEEQLSLAEFDKKVLENKLREVLDRDTFIAGMLSKLETTEHTLKSIADNRDHHRDSAKSLSLEIKALKNRSLWQRIWNK